MHLLQNQKGYFDHCFITIQYLRTDLCTVTCMCSSKKDACTQTHIPWCFTSTETIRLIRDGVRWGGREITYLSLHCHRQNDSYIKMGSDESHFIVSLTIITVRDNVTRQCPQTRIILKRRESRSRIKPRPFCLPA